MQETVKQPATETDSPKTRGRRLTFSLAAAAIVILGSAIGYLALIPQTRVVPSQLARLVTTRPGVKAFDIKATSSLVQPVAKSGIKSLETAAKQFPAKTGIYSRVWRPSSNAAAATEIIAFLTPSTTTARSVYKLLSTQQLSSKSYAANSMIRRSTFHVSGIAGSSGAIYSSSAKPTAATANPTLGEVVFRLGRVVSLTETLSTSSTQNSVQVIARSEAAELRSVEPGFTLAVTSYPFVASSVWVVVTLILLLAVGYVPFALPRWRERQALLRSLDSGQRADTWSVVYKHTDSGWNAYVPALPGIDVSGDTRIETDQLLSEAIANHLDEMRRDGLPIPEQTDIQVGQVAEAVRQG
jgi:predicted RNase H-like HicB family nuclease/putative ubiquitin-RnfH superfamily antitoxin RatB of RatAB toxin-antitoxin module